MKSDEDAIRLRIADEIDQIADSAAFRLSGHSGVSVKRLRNRAAELRASSLSPGQEDAGHANHSSAPTTEGKL